jgi:hypothetical protein
MPNPAIQRLIAAGASPQRARAFTDQVMKKKVGSTAAPKPDAISVTEIAAVAPESITAPAVPVASVPMPTAFQPEVAVVQPESNTVSAMGMPAVAPSTQKPAKGANSWYDLQIASAAQNYKSSQGMPGYAAPDFGTPEFTQYYEYTKGAGSYPKFESKLLAQYAPTFNKAQKSTNLFDRSVTGAIKKGLSLTEITELIAGGTLKTNLTIEQQTSAASKLFDEYSNAQTKGEEFYVKSDQNYKFAMPDPKFTYGTSTNFKAGTIDVLNNKFALDAYKAKEKQFKDSKKYSARQIANAMVKIKANLAAEIKKKGYTPYKDETLLRDSLS